MTDDDFLDTPSFLEGLTRLVAVERFAMRIADAPWFAHVGQPLLEDETATAHAYLDALGAVEATVAPVENWAGASAGAENPGFNSTWWDAEEQLRIALTVEALEDIHEDELTLALARAGEQAATTAGQAAAAAVALARISDEELVRAATGAAVQVSHQRALLEAAAAPPDHPFVHKFALFEAGRWPIAVIGESFHLF